MIEFMNLDNASKAEKEIVQSILFTNSESNVRRTTFFKDLSPSYKAILHNSELFTELKPDAHLAHLGKQDNHDVSTKVKITHHQITQHNDIVSEHQAVSSQHDIPSNLNGQGEQHQINYYSQSQGPANSHPGGPPHQVGHHPQMPVYPQIIHTPSGQIFQQFPYQMQYAHPPPHPHNIGLPAHMQPQYIPTEASDVTMHHKLHEAVHYSSADSQTGQNYRNNKNQRSRRNEVNAFAAPAPYYPNMNYPPMYLTTQSVTNMTGSPIIMPGSAAPQVFPQHFSQMYPPNLGNEVEHQSPQQHVSSMVLASSAPTNAVQPVQASSVSNVPMVTTSSNIAVTNSLSANIATVNAVLSSSNAISKITSPSRVNSETINTIATTSSDIKSQSVPKSTISANETDSKNVMSNKATKEEKVMTEQVKLDKEITHVVPKSMTNCPATQTEPNAVNSATNSRSQGTLMANKTTVVANSSISNKSSKTSDKVVPTSVSKTFEKSVPLAPSTSSNLSVPSTEKVYKDSAEFPQLGTTNGPGLGTSNVGHVSKGQSWACIASRKTVSPSNGSTTPTNDQAQMQKTADENCKEPIVVSERNPSSAFTASLGFIDSATKEITFDDDPVALKLGEYLSNYVLDHHTFSLTPRGLSNQSNFCYINATLQALVACPPFVNLFRSLQDILGKKLCKSTPIIQSVFDFIMEFEPITRVSQARNRKPFDSSFYVGANFEASGIRKVLGLLDGATFKVEGRQEDAEEFLSHLLNGLHDEMIKVMNYYNLQKERLANKYNQPTTSVPPQEEEEDNDNDQWQVMGPKNKGCMTRKTSLSKSPISEMFVGQMCSALNRANSLKSTTLQPFFTLQLDIQPENVHTIREALEGLSLKEEVTGCISSSGVETEAWKQLSLEVLPTILILHMKRFVFDTTVNTIKKLDKRVDFSIDLEIARDLLSLNSKTKYNIKQRQYKLFAVVYHDGEEAIKGHYIADTFHPSGGSLWGQFGWIRYDDTTVRGVVENQILNPQPPRVPYLLYYRRVDTLSQSKKDRS